MIYLFGDQVTNTKQLVTIINIEPIRSKDDMRLSIGKKLELPGIATLLSLVSGNSIAYSQKA
ncbi:MAG TPA: hypothetical protein VJR94_07530 [Candidatus Nitrosocosmicus sp.]|nr:hypothetical protein [Candidatus Nitrosocosmicus sp.]